MESPDLVTSSDVVSIRWSVRCHLKIYDSFCNFVVCFSAIIHPPPTWTKMDGRDLEIITLQSDSVEYKNIETAFLKSSVHRDVKPVQVQQVK